MQQPDAGPPWLAHSFFLQIIDNNVRNENKKRIGQKGRKRTLAAFAAGAVPGESLGAHALTTDV